MSKRNSSNAIASSASAGLNGRKACLLNDFCGYILNSASSSTIRTTVVDFSGNSAGM